MDIHLPQAIMLSRSFNGASSDVGRRLRNLFQLHVFPSPLPLFFLMCLFVVQREGVSV